MLLMDSFEYFDRTPPGTDYNKPLSRLITPRYVATSCGIVPQRWEMRCFPEHLNNRFNLYDSLLFFDGLRKVNVVYMV